MDIKPLASLTRTQRQDMAYAAAERGEQLHEACPYLPGTPEHQEFHDDYVAHRLTPEPERA